jgi:Uma2 family endonuclease
MLVEEYLSTVYNPDVDFVDGHIEERNLGEKEHSTVQLRLAFLLYGRLFPYIEARLQISPDRYRVPDICAYEVEQDESILIKPPSLCVEILSPEDRLIRVAEVVTDYRSIGVSDVWVIDPLAKCAFIGNGSDYKMWPQAENQLRTSDGRVVIVLADLFSKKMFDVKLRD